MLASSPSSWRVLRLRHYDVQLMGGMALHDGRLAEMATGEGKTLVALLPIYLNAITGESAFVVTTNDYLAARDGETMGQVFRFLGNVSSIFNCNDVIRTLRRDHTVLPKGSREKGSLWLRCDLCRQPGARL